MTNFIRHIFYESVDNNVVTLGWTYKLAILLSSDSSKTERSVVYKKTYIRWLSSLLLLLHFQMFSSTYYNHLQKNIGKNCAS